MQSTHHHGSTATKRKGSPKLRIEPKLQEFFDRFVAAVTAGDGKTVATMWEYPAYFLGDDMTRAEAEPEAVEKWFSGAKELYAEKGISDTRAEIQKVEWVTSRLVEVDVRLPHLDAAGVEHGEESSRYTLRIGKDGRYKLCAALMKGEKK